MVRPEKQCTSRTGHRKKRWATKTAAQFVVDWGRTQDGLDMYAYECEDCGGWHTATNREGTPPSE